MLGSLIRFEWRYYLRQPSFIVTALIFFLFSFLATVSRFVQIGGGGEVLKNGTFSIAQTLLILGLFSIFLIVNFIGNTATRDHSSQMEELLYSNPMPVWQYQLGRFIGSFAVVLAVFAFVPLGILLGSWMPWVDQEQFGPTNFAHYLLLFVMLPLPTLFVLSALFFTIAQKFRSMMAMYLVAVAVFICYNVAIQLASEPQYRDIAALLDPFGFATFMEVSRYWTISEKNTLVPAFEGVLMQNRLLWSAVGILLIVTLGNLWGKLTLAGRGSQKAKAQVALPQYALSVLTTKASGFSAWQQFQLRTVFEMRQIFFSMPFIILGLLTIFNIAASLIDPPNVFGTPNLPLTTNMIELIIGSTAMLNIIILVYYCAEVVWRERTSGMGDIVDSLPVPNMVFWLSKLTAIMLLILSLFVVCALTTMVYQLAKGVEQLELSQYLIRLGFFALFPFMLNVVLIFLLQVLSPNKYIGMLAYLLFFALQRVLDAWGFEHNMFQYGTGSSRPYSDMNGYGWAFSSYSWYMLYWSALAAVFFVLGYGLYQRGPAQSLKARWHQLGYQIGGKGKFAMLLAGVVFVSTGGWIHYNTRVLNEFITSEERLDLQEAYEKQFKQYQGQPILVATDVHAKVDIFPQEKRIHAVVTSSMRNKYDQPIEKMLVSLPSNTKDIQIDIPGATLGEIDDKFNIAWLTFAQPIAPQQVVQMVVTLNRQQQGFADTGQDTSVVENGTFINNAELLPRFGYQSNFELSERHERSKRGLPPPQRDNKLEDSRFYQENFFGPESDFINYEAVVSTAADQIAISPGYLQKEWQENDRRYFHYKMDQPMVNFYSFLSGRLEVKRETYKGVALEVYYHPTHHWNVDRMLESLRDSLDLFTTSFGPYQHKQMRVIEFPGYRSFAQSFANTVPYSEAIGFTADLRDPENIDSVYYVTAHEMAHQWWGHQVGAANVQGSQVISESLSQYAALRVVEEKYGEAKLREFLRRELDSYLSGRSGERLEEMPFMRAEGQQYIHYNKGSVVLMALKDAIGAPRMDQNLKNFLEEFRFKANPYPTTLDLVRHLKQDLTDAEQALVDELFSTIQLYDLRLLKVAKKELPNDMLELTLTISAAKMSADGKGVETAVDLAESFEIGAFDQDPDDFAKDTKVLYLQKHPLKTGTQDVVIQVPNTTKYIGVDPLVKKVDRDSGDNIQKL